MQTTTLEHTVRQNPNRFALELSPYIPHEPTGKQTAFLLLNNYREAFYGGAAGGGKSDALLMGALQYVDNPFYNAIIFRRTFADLQLAQALISRSLEWLLATDARWVAQSHKWVFPSGATLAFGYLDSELNKYRYQSAAFSYIAFDELTQFYEDDYLYLFSRLRREACTTHQIDEKGRPIFFPEECEECAFRSSIRLRMRAASNPGGIGHMWVKDRFNIQNIGGIYRGTVKGRPYIPAFLKDNPFLDQESYGEVLKEMDPVTREQLLSGDWGVSADGRIKKHWLKYFSVRGDYIIKGPGGRGDTLDIKTCFIFQSIDVAASAREGPGDEQIWRKMPSWTVIGTWLLDVLTGDLFLWHVLRFRKEIPEIIIEIRENFNRLHKEGKTPQKVGIEADGLGIGVFQIMSRTGLPITDLRTGSKDKLVRATDFINRCEQGKVFLPERAPWLSVLESELYTWTAHPKETDDQIDMCGYAGKMATVWATEYVKRADGTEVEGPTAY